MDRKLELCFLGPGGTPQRVILLLSGKAKSARWRGRGGGDGRVQFSGRWGKSWVASECVSVLLGPVSKEVRELAVGCAQAWELGDRFCPAALAPEDPESNSAISRTKRGPGPSGREDSVPLPGKWSRWTACSPRSEMLSSSSWRREMAPLPERL